MIRARKLLLLVNDGFRAMAPTPSEIFDVSLMGCFLGEHFLLLKEKHRASQTFSLFPQPKHEQDREETLTVTGRYLITTREINLKMSLTL